MQDNGVLKAVREGRVALGQMIREFCTRGMPKIMEAAELDYMMIDFEHGGMSIERLSEMAAYCKATPVSLFVRIPIDWTNLIAPILDQGIMGIQVSGVETPEQARKVVSFGKYAPVGDRGIASSGAHNDFQTFSQDKYVPWANKNVMLIAAVETPVGVENLDAIAAVDGIDVISIGHSDLTARMGIHMQLEHPRFKEVLHKTVDACKRHGKLARIYPHNDAQLREYYEMGFRVMGIPQLDIALYRDALKAKVHHFRECLATVGSPAG
jgi:2-keto-3-deoxy-L-rhamnonate aldolase RhmA